MRGKSPTLKKSKLNLLLTIKFIKFIIYYLLLLLKNFLDFIKRMLDKIDAKMVANASTLHFLLKNVFDTFNIHIKANV